MLVNVIYEIWCSLVATRCSNILILNFDFHSHSLFPTVSLGVENIVSTFVKYCSLFILHNCNLNFSRIHSFIFNQINDETREKQKINGEIFAFTFALFFIWLRFNCVDLMTDKTMCRQTKSIVNENWRYILLRCRKIKKKKNGIKWKVETKASFRSETFSIFLPGQMHFLFISWDSFW